MWSELCCWKTRVEDLNTRSGLGEVGGVQGPCDKECWWWWWCCWCPMSCWVVDVTADKQGAEQGACCDRFKAIVIVPCRKDVGNSLRSFFFLFDRPLLVMVVPNWCVRKGCSLYTLYCTWQLLYWRLLDMQLFSLVLLPWLPCIVSNPFSSLSYTLHPCYMNKSNLSRFGIYAHNHTPYDTRCSFSCRFLVVPHPPIPRVKLSDSTISCCKASTSADNSLSHESAHIITITILHMITQSVQIKSIMQLMHDDLYSTWSRFNIISFKKAFSITFSSSSACHVVIFSTLSNVYAWIIMMTLMALDSDSSQEHQSACLFHKKHQKDAAL